MKIFRHIFTATLCVAMTASLSSCVNNWLDQTPADGIEAETAIQSSSALSNARTGIYAAVKGNSTLVDYYARLMFVYGDVRGEDVQYEPNNGSGRAQFYYYMNYSTADDFGTSTAIWQTPYVVIARANRVIEAAESGQIADAEEAKAEIAQYVAEAKVLRAMALFDLTRVYGKPYTMDQGASLGVPVVTSSVDPDAKLSRNTVAECYQAIEKDLNDAITSGALIEESTKGYINLWAAKALQVRVYLTKGEWENALSVAEDIMACPLYSLWSTSEYVDAWSETSVSHVKEMLFELTIDDTTDWTDREGIAYLYADKARVGYGDVIITKAFSEMLTSDEKDVRNDVFLTPADSKSPYAGNKVYINKMPAVNGDPRYADVPVLRLSEVYLSAAEAAFQLNQKDKAANYLNAIISNRTTDDSKQVTQNDITLDRIYLERRKELVGEGQRYFDVLRRGETVVRYTTEEDRGWHDVLTEEAKKFDRNSKKALPLIPASEMNANPNMVQNPTY